ncbi:MAG: metal ABC transporter ATP-binding protein [Chloroflexi bacterium]|nr:metal ABC transporter ATP-binding protein [Chloroflexota bacterium]
MQIAPSPVTGAPLVEIRGLTCGYDGRPVLQDVDLTIQAGQFAGVVGPSGSGKTTLIRSILGVVDRYGGAVRVGGEPVDRRGGRARIGYVPQLETIDWGFPATVEQVVMMGLAAESSLLPWSSRRERARMHGLLERLGIAETARRHIRDLSGGQQQRVFLARALIREPRLLLLDEPTTGADIKTRHEVLHLLSDLNAEGMTIFLSTHDLNSVAAHLPWVVCMNGRILAEGHPDDVFTPDILSRTYGSEMVVLREGGMIVVADKLSALRAREGHNSRSGETRVSA